MSDDQEPSPLDRRRFLTVLGVSAGGGALALSGCSTDRVEKLVPYLVQSEDQVPGVATWYSSTCTECASGLRRPRAHPRGPRGQARGQPRPPGQPGQALLPRPGGAPGAVQPRADQGRRWLRGADGSFTEITWDDAIARLAAKLAEAGERGRGDLRRGSRDLLRSPGRVDRGARRAAGPPRDRSITSPCGPRTARSSVSTSCRRYDFGRAQVHRLLRRRLPGHLGLARSRTSAASPGRTDSARATSPSSSTPARAGTSRASTPTSGCRSRRARRRRSRWRWPTCS